MSILLDAGEIEQVLDAWTEGKSILTGPQMVSKATGKKILIKLQAVYNLPDEGMFHKKMGEFIEELMEEVK